MNTHSAKTEFTGWRAIFWPIHNHELKKFLPMGLMMFCILFIYTILRDTKDSILVNAPGSGAESLSFIKGIGVTFAAILFMILYTKGANLFKREGLFYVTALPFLIFFVSFAFFIYPNKHLFHMNIESIHHYQQIYPKLKWIIPLIGSWTFSLFYILSELWGSAVLSLLFWQFANAVTPVKEAKRFYGMFGFLGNFALIFSGPLLIYISKKTANLGLSSDLASGLSLKYLMSTVLLIGLVLLGTFYWINRNVLTDKRYYDPEAMGEGKKAKKPKLSIVDSFKYILSSSYLGLIAMLVLSYGISVNLFEAMWKGQLKILFPNMNDYNVMMGTLSTVTGVVTVFLMLIGSNVLRRVSWRTAALITPIILMLGSLVFFGMIFYNNSQVPIGMNIATALKENLIDKKLVMIICYLGLIINALAKGVKYSLFDSTKEIAYIPLDPELKVKGKAAVDVIGGRGGKAGGGYIQMGLLTIFSSSPLYQLVHIIAPIAVGIVILWILSVFGLSKKFKDITNEHNA